MSDPKASSAMSSLSSMTSQSEKYHTEFTPVTRDGAAGLSMEFRDTTDLYCNVHPLLLSRYCVVPICNEDYCYNLVPQFTAA